MGIGERNTQHVGSQEIVPKCQQRGAMPDCLFVGALQDALLGSISKRYEQ